MEQFKFVRELFSKELSNVNELIIDNLSNTDIPLIVEIGHHITQSGGKRVRPMLVLLSANLTEYKNKKHILLAAVIEFIHTATLLHDDVIDESLLRRKSKTANAIWGDKAAILVGDFLYSRAFQMLVSANNMKIMNVMANATNTIAEGEVLQLLNSKSESITEKQYFEIIYRKTAKLFSASTEIGALLGENQDAADAMKVYGKSLGIAFQLIDDVLDYSEKGTTGKDTGNDLAEGKITLPVIHSLQNCSLDEKEFLLKSFSLKNKDNLSDVISILKNNDSLEYTREKAISLVEIAKKSIQNLKRNKYFEAAHMLLDFTIDRNH